MGQDNNAGRGQAKHRHPWIRRTAGIATGVIVLFLGVLAIAVLRFPENEAGGASQDAGVGTAPAGEIAFARDGDGDGRGELSLISADGSNLHSLPNTIKGDS
ncbi:MAG TPA: hypothetical protein VFS96_07250, partial [Nitrolancea sp.]|nr:hypothetical protein [Nitrolancea sp.]